MWLSKYLAERKRKRYFKYILKMQKNRGALSPVVMQSFIDGYIRFIETGHLIGEDQKKKSE